MAPELRARSDYVRPAATEQIVHGIASQAQAVGVVSGRTVGGAVVDFVIFRIGIQDTVAYAGRVSVPNRVSDDPGICGTGVKRTDAVGAILGKPFVVVLNV